MVNKILLRELENKKDGHKIFNHQKSSDLKEVVKILENKETNDITINFKLDEWPEALNIIFSRESNDEILKTCREYIASKLLVELTKKNKELEGYNGEKYLSAFKNGDVEEYEKVKKNLLSVKDIIDLIEIENIPVKRIHFIMNGNKSNILCDSLTLFLEDNLPFSTSIYSSPNGFYTTLVPDAKDKIFMWDAYNYTAFEAYAEGIVNTAIKPKEKVKK